MLLTNTTQHTQAIIYKSTACHHFDTSRITTWLHKDQQNNGRVKGSVIYSYLKKRNILNQCLNLDDLNEILKRDDAIFKKRFPGKAIFAFGSVTKDIKDDVTKVPYLIAYSNRILLNWKALEEYWDGHGPAGLWPKLELA